MELNEYAVWRTKIQKMERQYAQIGTDMEYAGEVKVLLDLTIVAPKGKLGRALLDVHFDNAFCVSTPMEDGKRWSWVVEPTEEKLHNVIRYEDAYRGRM